MGDSIAQSDIQKFYENKSVFITGCTGFLGKVLLEKLLRSCPRIESVYVLARNKKGKNIHSRIEDLISNEAIFGNLRDQQPKFREKLVVINGDVAQERLGIDDNDRRILTEKVSIIFHVAATVRFDEHLRKAVTTNVQGVKEIIDFARECKKLESVMHVSTAYSHCLRKEIDEKFYPTPCDPQSLVDIAKNTPEEDIPAVKKNLLSDWPNTYAFTKAVSEEVVRLNGDGLPICVFRPAVVTAANEEPLPGWIDNVNGLSGVMLGVAMGVLRVGRVDPNCIAEMVPVDLVVNSMIAVAYHTAKTRPTGGIPIYNYVSSPRNPILWKESTGYCFKHGQEIPSEKCIWRNTFFCIRNIYLFHLAFVLLHYLPAVLFDLAAVLTRRKPQLLSIYRKVAKFTDAIAFFATRQWVFSDYNTRKVWDELSVVDKQVFPFDITRIEWETYLINAMHGLRKYICKEDPSTIPAARRRYQRLKLLHYALQLILLAVFVTALYHTIRKFFVRV